MIFCVGFVLLLAASLLLGSVVNGLEECAFDAYGLLPYDELVRCLHTLKVDYEQPENLYKTLQQYIELSGFVNYLKDPPAPFEHMKMDQVAELKKLEEKYNQKLYEYEYDRQADIFNLFNSFRDGHQYYSPNSCFAFNYYLLAFPYPVLDESGYTAFELGMLAGPIATAYESLLQDGLLQGSTIGEIESQLGQRVTHINSIEIVDYFKQKAKEWTYSYDTAVNMNNLWNLGFMAGTNYICGLPSEDITYTLENGITLTVSYIYESGGNLGSDHTLAACMNSASIMTSSSDLLKETLLNSLKKKREAASEVSSSVRFTLVDEGISSNEFAFSVFLDDQTDEFVGELRLNSFPSDKSINALIGYLKMWADDGTDTHFLSKLIIDVRNNGGGSIEANNYLNSWLNWDISEPNSDLKRHRKTKEMQWMAKNWDGFGTAIGLDNLYTSYDPYDFSVKMYLPEMLENSEKISYRDATVDPPTENYDEMTQLMTQFNEDIPLSQTQTAALNGLYQQIFDFDRVDVTIINDGQCASSCAEFMWLAKEYGTARIITVGGLRTPTEEYVPQFHITDGGRVLASDSSIELIRKSGEMVGLDVSALPDYLPEGTRVGFVDTILYSFEDPSVPYQFKSGVGDFHMFYYSPPLSDFVSEYPELLDKIFAVLEDREHYPVAEKERDIKRTQDIKNGLDAECQPRDGIVYGRKWNGTAQDYTGECLQLYCGNGYYFDHSSKSCKELITIESKYDDLLKTQQDELNHSKTALIATSVLTGVFGVAAIAFGVLYFLSLKKNNNSGGGDFGLVQRGAAS